MTRASHPSCYYYHFFALPSSLPPLPHVLGGVGRFQSNNCHVLDHCDAPVSRIENRQVQVNQFVPPFLVGTGDRASNAQLTICLRGGEVLDLALGVDPGAQVDVSHQHVIGLSQEIGRMTDRSGSLVYSEAVQIVVANLGFMIILFSRAAMAIGCAAFSPIA